MDLRRRAEIEYRLRPLVPVLAVFAFLGVLGTPFLLYHRWPTPPPQDVLHREIESGVTLNAEAYSPDRYGLQMVEFSLQTANGHDAVGWAVSNYVSVDNLKPLRASVFDEGEIMILLPPGYTTRQKTVKCRIGGREWTVRYSLSRA